MIGFDLQEVEMVKDEEKLLQKIALQGEIEYIHRHKCNIKMRVASLWAVKEAVFKALGFKAEDVSYKEIELCHKDSGQPYIVLHGNLKKRFEDQGFCKIEISLSHQKSVVGAVCLVN